jgi:hypothetical protein
VLILADIRAKGAKWDGKPVYAAAPARLADSSWT